MEKIKAASDDDRRSRLRVSRRGRLGVIVGTILATIWLAWSRFSCSGTQMLPFTRTPSSDVERAQQCAIDNLHKDLYFLEPAKPITSEEFILRRDRLAEALAASDVDAFVLEPGYTFQYVGVCGLRLLCPMTDMKGQVLWQYQPAGLGAMGARGATISHARPSYNIIWYRQSEDSFPVSQFRRGPRPHVGHSQ